MSNRANVLIGAPATFKIGAYVDSKGAATLADAGFTLGGVTFDPTVEFHEVEVDQYLAKLSAVPKKRDAEIKVKLVEATLENLRIALGQPAANLTGTAPDLTLLMDASAGEAYHQIQFVGPGVGTTGSRTITAWRTYVKQMTGYAMMKDEKQIIDLTFGLCEEVTGTGADSFLNAADT